MEYLFLVSRILFGGYFFLSGLNHLAKPGPLAQYAASKRVPMPKTAVIVTGVMLLLGGLGIVLWAFVDIAVILIALFLIVTTFMMHNYWKDTDPMVRMNNQINFMKNLALLGASIMYLFWW